MGQSFVTKEEFDAFKAEMATQYDQIRKLMTKQIVAMDQKLQVVQSHLEHFTSRKPDPGVIRDAWIRQVPKIREDLRLLQMHVAKLSAAAGKREEVKING